MPMAAIGSSRFLSRSDFLAWLDAQLAAGRSRADLGRMLGVSGAAIRQWQLGCRVSATVLLLADRLIREQSAADWPL